MLNKKIILFLSGVLTFSLTHCAFSQQDVRTIHIFVALCDNENQGIVKVPSHLGNGNDPESNLYWGARYGVKSFFANNPDWNLIKVEKNPVPGIRERCIFRHRRTQTFIVADAYKGDRIKQTIIDFIKAASGNKTENIIVHVGKRQLSLKIGCQANLIAYIGHNGLMDFTFDEEIHRNKKIADIPETIILACFSKSYFSELIRKSGAIPLLWTMGLMAPEAYTLKSAIDGWILNETPNQIRRRAANAYHKYQKCGIKRAMNLFVTGW